MIPHPPNRPRVFINTTTAIHHPICTQICTPLQMLLYEMRYIFSGGLLSGHNIKLNSKPMYLYAYLICMNERPSIYTLYSYTHAVLRNKMFYVYTILNITMLVSIFSIYVVGSHTYTNSEPGVCAESGCG